MTEAGSSEAQSSSGLLPSMNAPERYVPDDQMVKAIRAGAGEMVSSSRGSRQVTGYYENGVVKGGWMWKGRWDDFEIDDKTPAQSAGMSIGTGKSANGDSATGTPRVRHWDDTRGFDRTEDGTQQEVAYSPGSLETTHEGKQ